MGLEVRNCTLHRVCLSLLDRYSQVSPRTSDTLVPFISWHISSGVSVTLENNSCVDSLKKRVTHIFEVAATFIAMKHFSKMKKNTQLLHERLHFCSREVAEHALLEMLNINGAVVHLYLIRKNALVLQNQYGRFFPEGCRKHPAW